VFHEKFRAARLAHRRLTFRVAIVAPLVIAAAACSSSSKTGVSSGAATTAAGSGATSSGATSPLGPDKKATGTPVKVGVFNVEGGSIVSLPEVGDAEVAAAKYANDHLNGLGGHQIVIDRCGDKADGASATACANQFVQDKVVAVVTGQPATADQLVPTIAAAKIPYFGSSPSAATETVTPGLYFVSPGFLGTLSAWATYSKSQGYKSFGIFVVDNPQAIAAVNALGGLLFKKAGIALQVNVIPQGTADATALVQAGLGKKPDVVGIVGDGTTCQAILSGLKTAATSVPRIGIIPCLGKSVVDALGSDGLNGMVMFDNGDSVGNNPEAQLYRAVMKQYAPSTDIGGETPIGYMSMLGFVRAVNAGGLTGDATSASTDAAIKAASNVPLPLGEGQTFSCGSSTMGTAIIKSTICNSKVFQTTVKGTAEGTSFAVVDAAPLFTH
jgi:branched-chain amino acid transport system substrate-binding protein